MPNLELEALGEEPGYCRQAAMDHPHITLFGKTIRVTASHTGAGADAGVIKPTSASPTRDRAPTSSQDGGGSVLLGIENKEVGEKLVSARSSSRDDFLQLYKGSSSELATEPYRTPNLGATLCDESDEAPSDEVKDLGDGDSVGDGKNLQKPDKVVSCPRCNSQDTKFCYYNNYNVNQPRHFCKNCQRYWTAGGTLRNVPVGAGRRKNKTGSLQQQQQRDMNCTETSLNCPSFPIDSGDSASQLYSCGLGSPTSQQKATMSLKIAHPKRIAGPSSPLRSPGSTASFGQESGVTMSSPTYSLYQNGRLPFQQFNTGSQGFTNASGPEVSAVGSSDSASTLRVQMLARYPSGNGFDKDCTRSSLSGQLQDAATFQGAMQTAALNASMLQREPSGTYRSDIVSGGPVRCFNGEWPHGYNTDWDGKQQKQLQQHSMPASQQGLSTFAPGAPILTSYNTVAHGLAPPNSTWVRTQWGSNATGHVTIQAQMATPNGCTGAQQQQQSTLGKRQGAAYDGGRVNHDLPAKTLRTDLEFKNMNSRSSWPMLPGRNQSMEVHSSCVGGSPLKQLFHPKLEHGADAPSGEPKDTFITRLFHKAAATSRAGPFPVTT